MHSKPPTSVSLGGNTLAADNFGYGASNSDADKTTIFSGRTSYAGF